MKIHIFFNDALSNFHVRIYTLAQDVRQLYYVVKPWYHVAKIIYPQFQKKSKVKESKTNQNPPQQRDTWAVLQTQLGLLSSPIKQEQVSVVSVADQTEGDLKNHEILAEVPEYKITSTRQESDTVAANTLLPTTSENQGDLWDVNPRQNADELFGFDLPGDCDIPKNAFAPPKKPKTFQKAETFASSTVVGSQDAPENHDLSQAPKAGPGESESIFAPYLPDELPTSLWQPRKPASVAKTSTPVNMPSFSGGMSQIERQKKESKSDFHKQDEAESPVDDLARHSSGKKRHERSGDRQEKSIDRKSRQTVQGEPDSNRYDFPGRIPDHWKRHQPKSITPRPSLDDFVMNDPVNHRDESSCDDLAWEPKQISKGKSRRPDKSFRQTDIPAFAFADRKDEPESYAPSQDRGTDKNDWLEDGMELEPIDSRPAQKNPKYKSSVEKKKMEPEKDVRHTFDAEEVPARHARVERDIPPHKPIATKRTETPAQGLMVGTPSQKITVSSWDDAVQGIIEKNMQRRPAPKNDRQVNSRGRRH